MRRKRSIIELYKDAKKIIVHTPKADQEKQYENEDELIEAFFLCVYNILGYEAYFKHEYDDVEVEIMVRRKTK